MKNSIVNPGSFRDPKGQVLIDGDRVIRLVYSEGAKDYEFVRDKGFYKKLTSSHKLVGLKEIVSDRHKKDYPAATRYIVEHPRLEFISYPYEWPFSILQSAALFHLDLYLEALNDGIILSDASAFNIQFHGTRPVFIDHLSFRPYQEGEYWQAHRQFCEQFLNPLLFYSVFGVPYNSWYRGAMDGLKTTELNRLLPWHSSLSPTVFFHVTMQAYFQEKQSLNSNVKNTAKLPLQSLKNILLGLKKQIGGLKVRNNLSKDWQHYANKNSYNQEESRVKQIFIEDYAKKARPKTIWDLGCNTGEYSVIALKAGVESAIGFDSDHAALDAGYKRALDEGLNFLPLYMDITNPSPSQGWTEKERGGLSARDKPDGVIALALIHHLVIARNIPMDYVITWFLSLAPTGIIEFVPKDDPMAQILLRHRQDIFPDYTSVNFIERIQSGARIISKKTITASGRILVWYESGIGFSPGAVS